MEHFTGIAEERRISLSFRKHGDIPSIPVDRDLMRRVIANLLDNAIRHSPKGGTVQVATSFLPEKGGLCLTVKHDGNGLAPEYHQKIFDKFEQVRLK